MAYGRNQPWGLQAIKTINGGTWNGQTSQYLISSGYELNIFKGDLVYLGHDGFIHNLAELTANPLQTAQALGVFNGCSFTTPTSINPIDPSSPGRQFWPALTVTPGGVPATCDIIDDPSVIYNVQSDAVGFRWTNIGDTLSVAYSYVIAPNPSGNFQTGASSLVVLGRDSDHLATRNVRVLRFVPTPDGLIPSYVNPNVPVPFSNAEVIIQNHSFMQRAVGL